MVREDEEVKAVEEETDVNSTKKEDVGLLTVIVKEIGISGAREGLGGSSGVNSRTSAAEGELAAIDTWSSRVFSPTRTGGGTDR